MFNIKRDPLEMKDLADNKKSEKVIKRLYKQLLNLQKANNDSLDLKAAFPNLG